MLDEIVKLWNGSVFPKVKIMSDARKKKLAIQIKKYPDLEHWVEALQKLQASEFCTSKWRPCFDDFLSESKRIAAIEGRYDNKDSGNVYDWADITGQK